MCDMKVERGLMVGGNGQAWGGATAVEMEETGLQQQKHV